MSKLYTMSKSLDKYDLYDERMIDNAFEKEKNLKSHSFQSIGTTLYGRSRYMAMYSSFYGYNSYSLIKCNMVKGSYGLWCPHNITYQDILDKLYFSFLGFKLCKILKIKVLNMHI